MKTFTIIFITTLLLTSCNNTATPSGGKDFETITIENCQYLVRTRVNGDTGYGFMAHKGNCTNPTHTN
jgi:hypothetical protein